MPTETFYNLPEEKRGRLVKAIYLELARVPFSEMSINRIIKEAQISRGSGRSLSIHPGKDPGSGEAAGG